MRVKTKKEKRVAVEAYLLEGIDQKRIIELVSCGATMVYQVRRELIAAGKLEGRK